MSAGAKSEISSTYFAAVAAAVVSSTLKSYAGMGSSSSPLKPNDTDRTAGSFDELSLLEPNAERSCSPLYDGMEATYLPRTMPQGGKIKFGPLPVRTRNISGFLITFIVESMGRTAISATEYCQGRS